MNEPIDAGHLGRIAVTIAALLSVPDAGGAQTQSPPQPLAGPGRIEELIRAGWEVAGYVAASDIRTLILLKHKENPWLMQCSVLIDVTRTPRMVTTCYELR